MSRLRAALRRFWYPFSVQLRRALDWLRVDAEVERFLRGHGPEYIADTPDFDEHADAAVRQVLAGRDLDYARHLTQAERDKRICDELEWQFPKTKTRRIR